MAAGLNRTGVDLKLVELIRANPAIYEKEVRVAPYESVKQKNELWRSIAVSLGLETKYCLARWRNLRGRFRREYWKAYTQRQKSMWPLYEKMRFMENNIKYYGFHPPKVQTLQKEAISSTTWDAMDAEQLIETLALDEYEDALQEAMDESTLCAEKVTEFLPTFTTVNATQPGILQRIEVLLAGLDSSNRCKAEKRVIAYLCKCQLKSLNNEDVDDILI